MSLKQWVEKCYDTSTLLLQDTTTESHRLLFPDSTCPVKSDDQQNKQKIFPVHRLTANETNPNNCSEARKCNYDESAQKCKEKPELIKKDNKHNEDISRATLNAKPQNLCESGFFHNWRGINPCSLDAERRREMQKRYTWTTETRRCMEDIKYPKKIVSPLETTLELKVDMVRMRPKLFYASPGIWQKVANPWERVQLRESLNRSIADRSLTQNINSTEATLSELLRNSRVIPPCSDLSQPYWCSARGNISGHAAEECKEQNASDVSNRRITQLGNWWIE